MGRELVVGAALLGVGLLLLQQRPDVAPKERLSDFMERKVAATQRMLSSLSRRDLDGVRAAADSLGLVCLDESWNVIQSDEYVERSTAFRRTVASIAEAARGGKIERAELGYLELVGQCFSCHGWLRDRRERR
jgi:hypothetical protein